MPAREKERMRASAQRHTESFFLFFFLCFERVWVCVLISHMQSSRAFCMHRSYILCTAYTIYLFFCLVFFSFLLSSHCYGVFVSVALYCIQNCALYSLSHVYSWCAVAVDAVDRLAMCMWHILCVCVCVGFDELRRAVSTEQMSIRMAVRWCRCHCWCIEYLSARKEAKLQCIGCIVRLCLHAHSFAHVCVVLFSFGIHTCRQTHSHI